MTREEIWGRLRVLWESTGRSAAAAARLSAPAWAKLRTMWEARRRRVEFLDVPGVTEEPSIATPVEPVRIPSRHEMSGTRLNAVDEAIQAQDAASAMRGLQPLILEERVGGEVLKRAARVMRLLNEDVFAMLFDAAVASPATGPAIDLASSFLEVDDARMALAMARMALQRGGHDDPMVHALIAEGHARQGDHEGVIAALARFKGNWPEPTLLRRYALSALLAGDVVRWAEVRDELARDGHAGWILAAAERAEKYDDMGDFSSWYRSLLFMEYGSLLIEPEPVFGLPVREHTLANILHAAGDALEALECVPDRIAHVGKSGEVFAHWLGAYLNVMVMPLSARISGQSVMVVAADDADVERVAAEPRYAEGPVTLFQIVKSPTYSGVPMADIVGLLGADVSLPIQPVIAAKAADRLPPRLMVAELERRAGPMLALEPDGDGELEAWLTARRADLAVCRPVEAGRRPPYVADLAGPPEPEIVEVVEEPPEVPVEPPVQGRVELEAGFDGALPVEAPPAS